MKGKIAAKIDPQSLKLREGETAEVTTSIKNLGQTVDQFTLSVAGLDPNWYTLPITSVALFPNDEDKLRLIIHPPKRIEGKPGTYLLHITVSSRDNPEEIVTSDLTITVGALPGLELDILPKQIIGRKAAYRVQVKNPGISQADVRLETTDEIHRLRFRLGSKNLTVPSGGSAETSLEVSTTWLAYFVSKKTFPFKVGAAIREEKEPITHKFCMTCGHEFQPRYDAIPLLGPWYSKKISRRFDGSPIFCSCCSHQIRSGVLTANAELVRLARAESQGTKSRFLRKIRFPRFTCCERLPIIDTLKVTTNNDREFLISWSVRRASKLKLNDEDVSTKRDAYVRPAGNMLYTLTAINRNKTICKSIEVRPKPLPPEVFSPRIGATLSNPKVRVQAGIMPQLAFLEVQNLGDIVDKFNITVEGIDESWCTRSAASIALMPQSKGQVHLNFNPPKKEGVRAGDYPFVVSARSQSDPNEVTVVAGQLEVLPAPECRLDARPMRISCRRKGIFRIGVINTGVSDLTCSLEAHDLDEGCRFLFRPDATKIDVRAWNSAEVKMIAKPKQGTLLGEEKRFDIVVSVKASGVNAQPMNCQLHHRPLVRSSKTIIRFIKSIIVLAILGVLIYLILNWGGGLGNLIDDPGGWAKKLVETIKGWFQ